MSQPNHYSPAWPHGPIQEIFRDIFMLTGTNIIEHDGNTIQASRNMIIVRDNNQLSLINTVRLDANGIESLNSLGTVKHIIRTGAFHGRDDAFYLDHFSDANYWQVQPEDNSIHSTSPFTHLKNETLLPFLSAKFYHLSKAPHEEGFIHIPNIHNGVVITCDSIKNWCEVDKFFNETTGQQMREGGEIQSARISPIWLQATNTSKTDFNIFSQLEFKHLLSAHGEALKNNADDMILNSIENIQ